MSSEDRDRYQEQATGEVLKALVAVRTELIALLRALNPLGKLGEHLAPDRPPTPLQLLDLARRTKELLECVRTIGHDDLHSAAWLLLMHLNYYLEGAGLGTSVEFRALLEEKRPGR